MFFNPRIQRPNYLFEKNSSNSFVFPITGLDINTCIEIGNVTFYDYSSISSDIGHLKPFYKHLVKFPNLKTIAFVNTENVKHLWEGNCDNNLSIALMVLKQAIGFLYLTFYEYKGYNDAKRIIISSNNIHECEESMELYFSSDEILHCQDISKSLFLSVDDAFLEIMFNRKGRFLQLYKQDSDIKFPIVKQFEFLYDILNEIHSIERIYKMAAFLQMIFLRNHSQSFNYASSRIKSFIEQNGVKIETFEHSGKLNKILDDLYDNIRNKYSHGDIDLYNEFNVINASDYYIFYQVYMRVLQLLTYSVDTDIIKNKDELLSSIENYRQNNAK